MKKNDKFLEFRLVDLHERWSHATNCVRANNLQRTISHATDWCPCKQLATEIVPCYNSCPCRQLAMKKCRLLQIVSAQKTCEKICRMLQVVSCRQLATKYVACPKTYPADLRRNVACYNSCPYLQFDGNLFHATTCFLI